MQREASRGVGIVGWFPVAVQPVKDLPHGDAHCCYVAQAILSPL